MKHNRYLVWDEIASGTGLGVGTAITTVAAGFGYGVGRAIAIAAGSNQAQVGAYALSAALLAIFLAALLVNRLWGTMRIVIDAEPPASALARLLSGERTTPAKELAEINGGPVDIRDIARDSGLLTQLEKLAAGGETGVDAWK